jgi:hypothetical protein
MVVLTMNAIGGVGTPATSNKLRQWREGAGSPFALACRDREAMSFLAVTRRHAGFQRGGAERRFKG